MWVELDVETTGKSEQAEIIEVAAVVINERFLEIAHFNSLANPGEEAMDAAEPEALRINHITREMVREAPPAPDVARELDIFLDQYWGATFHAFNNDFDQNLLYKAPWSIKRRLWGECTMKAAMAVMDRRGALRIRGDGQPKFPRLSEAADFFKVTYGDGHRALHDCRVAARIHAEIARQREYATARRIANDEASHVMDHGL